jgi:hypothetical protein
MVNQHDNPRMTYRPWLIAAALGVAACTPSLNWREVRPEHTSLKTLLPCKPDNGSRQVKVGQQELEVRMTGCQAQEHLLAIARLPMPQKATEQETAHAIKEWQDATLANFKGQVTGTQAFVIKAKSAPSTTPVVKISASGQGPDGRPMQSQMLLFVHENQIVQAVVYAAKLSADVTETFFTSLELP